MINPYYGCRKIKIALGTKGISTSKNNVSKIMNELGIRAIYPKPITTVPDNEHTKYGYLLKGVKIKRSNQVWASDITYLRVNGNFVYLVAIIDVYSRKTLSFRVSNTMDTNFCIETLKEAFDKFGKPEIFNSDQGSQFTSNKFTDLLKEKGIKISMTGKGRCHDNIFVERLWRTLKYENIYLKEYESLTALKEGVEAYFRFYNSERFHQSLKYKTPDERYYSKLKEVKKVA